jgi:hypothetical protein
MFRRLQVKLSPKKVGPDPNDFSIDRFIGDASLPVTLKVLNTLPDNPKLRLYRALVPAAVLADFDINPRTWKNLNKQPQVKLEAAPGTSVVKLTAWYGADPQNEFFYLELADNAFNGIDLNFLVANNPLAERFLTDVDETGQSTQFGTARRNLSEEVRAMQAGLAPGQVRAGLRCSPLVFTHLEVFLSMLAHHAFFLEPLTYASAWLFEKRGLAYSRGHQLMDTIHKEFQPGGALHKALDGSTPFRQPEQWRTVRGRAWAIQDGLLSVIDRHWNDLKMIKQVGRHAGVNTFPDALY